MNRLRHIVMPALAAIAAAALVSSADAEGMYGPGASDGEIKIGHINPYSGPASAYGAIGKAIGAYFDKVNAEGGVNGRKVTFISYDDGYSPPKTVEQARRLVEQDGVLLIFQSLGTPSNTAIHKYMNQKKVPQLFVATGATKWDDPENYPWTMGWQPNYQTEAKIYARYIMANVPDAKIGVLYQNDDYGKDYLQGLRDGLGDKADKLITLAVSYETSDATVDSQMVQLKESGANVFVNITTPKWAAQAIKKAADIGWQPMHFLNNVSNSVPSVLKPAGLDKSVGLISSAYYKSPGDAQWADDPAMKEYLAFMAEYHKDANPKDNFNAYGYLVAQTLVRVLEQAGDNLTRENVMKEAANLKDFELALLLPGMKINTGPDDFAPIEEMQLEKFNGTQWELFGDILSGATGS